MPSRKQRGWWGWALSAALLVGCEPEEVDEEPQVEEVKPELKVEFLLPGERAATNGNLGIALKVQGGAPDRVELYVGDTWLANLDEASYLWDTRAWSEGEHTLTARAVVGKWAFTSPGRRVVVDRTPPRVVSTQPAAGDNNVAGDAPLSVVFSEPLASSALLSASLQVTVSGVGMETLKPRALSPDGKTLFFPKPSLSLMPPRTVSALLTGSVEDVAGNSFLPARDSSWAWEVPVLQVLGDAMAGLEPVSRSLLEADALRLDGEGRPMVAWESLGSVRVRRWEGSQWVSLPSGPPLGIAGIPTHLALDEQGRPTVTLVQRNTSASVVYLSRLEGGVWKQLAAVGSNAEGEFPFIDRAVGHVTPSGRVRVAWTASSKTDTETSQVMLWAQRESGDWDIVSRSNSARAGRRNIAMELEATGVPVIAWTELIDQAERVEVQRGTDVNPEAFAGLSTRGFHYVVSPSLVLQPNGSPVVAWSETGALQVHRWTGAGWEQLGQSLALPTDGSYFVVSALALDASGRPLLAWSLPGRLELWRWVEGDWVRLAALSRPASKVSSYWPVYLQMDSTGSPVLAWSRTDAAAPSRGAIEVFRLNR